ncbi:hypothetical protein ACWFQ8_29740 [Streptomyces sp. NPDC055254]
MTAVGAVIEAELLTLLERPPLAILYQTVVQSVPNGTWGVITFDSEEVDTYSGHSTSVNTSRYTCQYAGWYRVSVRAAFDVNATGSRGARIHLNGNYIRGGATLGGAGTLTGCPQSTHTLYLVPGDYIEGAGGQNSGGALSTAYVNEAGSRMEVEWIHA